MNSVHRAVTIVAERLKGMGMVCKGRVCIWEHAAVSGSIDIRGDNNANNQMGSARAVTEERVALAKEKF